MTKLPKDIEYNLLNKILKSFDLNFEDYLKYRTDESMIKSQDLLRGEKLTPDEEKLRNTYRPNYLLFPNLNKLK